MPKLKWNELQSRFTAINYGFEIMPLLQHVDCELVYKPFCRPS